VNATRTPALVALDIDGTLLGHDGSLSPAVLDAVAAVRRAGHHIVLASGRSLVGVLPIADRLRLTDGWAVASNGAVTARLDGIRHDLVDVQPVDVEAVVRLALASRPYLQIAVEEIGVGYRVTSMMPMHLVNGRQLVVRLEELWATESPRMILRGPGAADLVTALQALGVTAIPDGTTTWLDVTAGRISKASALEKVRAELGVDPANTIAVGDGLNDFEMLTWATRGVAMGHAPAELRRLADEVTGTIDQDGVVPVLRSLLSR
jgi:hydroxymethylpyrimidine pyrophosphatase-like HAD family hydrolase